MADVDRLKRLMAVWALLGLALAFFDRLLWNTIWVLVFAVWVGFALFGLLVFIRTLLLARRASWRRQEKLLAAATPVLCLLLLLAWSPLASIGDYTVFQYRFARHKAEYERIISEVLAEPSSRPRSSVRYTIDEGPPLRFAFPQPGGIIDNWEAVIYDPTGAVAAATGWKNGIAGSFSAPPHVLELFGGALLKCGQIEESFYRCWFT